MNKINKLFIGLLTLILTLSFFSFSYVKADDENNFNIDVENGTSTEIETGYNDSFGYEINKNSGTTSIVFYSDEIDNLEVFDEVLITFRVYYEYKKIDGYFKAYNPEGLLIDYGFVNNEWNKVSYVSRVYTKNDKKFVKVEFDSSRDMIFKLSSLEVSKYVDEGDLLGGVEVIQIEASNLMMAYVIHTPDDKVAVIDGGMAVDTAKLLDAIRFYKNKVDYWFLSHFHYDHSEAVLNIIKEENIEIENIVYDFPTTKVADEIGKDADAWLCDDLKNSIQNHPEKVKNYILPEKYDVYEIGDYITVKVLNDAHYDVYRGAYGNDTSVMYKFETPGESIFFSGDMNILGDEIIKDQWCYDEIFSCSLVQIAHHAQGGLSDYFYSLFPEIKAALYPACRWIYDNSTEPEIDTNRLESLHTRSLIRERGTLRIYVSMNGRLIIK